MSLPYFIKKLDIAKINSQNNGMGGKLETNEKLFVIDALCEGPIEGLVDKEGSLLKYISESTEGGVESIILGKGIYYNEVPLLDTNINKLNFVTSGFDISYGEEINNYKNTYASTIFRYLKKLYLNDSEYLEQLKKDLAAPATFTKGLLFHEADGAQADAIKKIITDAINTGQVFIHKIVNKYCNHLSINLKIDSLFSTSGGNTLVETFLYGIQIEEDNTGINYNFIGTITGISKGSYVLDIPILLNLDSLKKSTYYVKVIALSAKIPPSNANNFKEISVSAIIERVIPKNSFSYPFTAVVRSGVSSEHFNNDPKRTYDLKLLKIKTPKNYDSEVSQYEGNWNGQFDNFLRWTDNPAWIFYDLCVNSRYSISNGNISDRDINKWELYKISKYCDELVLVNTPSFYSEDSFTVFDENTILVDKSDFNNVALTLKDFKQKYPAINDETNSASNGGFNNSIIFLYNLSSSNNLEIEENFKKIIVSVDEVDLSADGKEIIVQPDGEGTSFRIQLMNDFGPRKFFEKNNDTEKFLQAFINANVKTYDTKSLISDRIKNSKNNTESGAKNFILSELNKLKNQSNSFASNFIKQPCFSQDFLKDEFGNKRVIKGFCLPKKLNYKDPLEKRFSCNVLIDNETEFLKILNDIASTFRGLTYCKNNLITATVDVDKPISYLFNNSNVKDGVFSYSSGSVDGSYSVAKVVYRDKYSNYDQQVEIVEDSYLINNYGISTKEILGFGITSRDQARRIGEWLLATNRFENQTVTFTTDLQGLMLKPSDVIQIEDQYKNNFVLQGRVIEVDYVNKYIIIDRKLNLNCTGQIIKFIADVQNKTISSLDNQLSVSDRDIDDLNSKNLIQLRIERIENNENKIYFHQDFNFVDFFKITKSAPFIIENDKSNIVSALYKVVSISEADDNQYSFFCIRHDIEKYKLLTKSSFKKNNVFANNTISFADSDSLKEVDFSGISGDKAYSIDSYSINQINSLFIDYNFNETKGSLLSVINKNYYVLTIFVSRLFNFIQEKSSANVEYYKNIQNIINLKGGLLFKIILKNQCLKFKIQGTDLSDKRIFLGNFVTYPNIISSISAIKIYVFDKDNRIIDV